MVQGSGGFKVQKFQKFQRFGRSQRNGMSGRSGRSEMSEGLRTAIIFRNSILTCCYRQMYTLHLNTFLKETNSFIYFAVSCITSVAFLSA